MSSASFKTNLSQSSQEKNVDLGQSQGFETEIPVMAQDLNKLSSAKLKLIVPATLDPVTTQCDFSLTSQRGSSQAKHEKLTLPEQSESSQMTECHEMIPELDEGSSVLSRDSSNSTPPPPGSGSPELDQLLTDLKVMKLKFRPETLDSPLSESSSESSEDEKAYMYDELSQEDPSPTENCDSSTQVSWLNIEGTPDVTRTSESNLDSHKKSDVSIMSPTESFSVPKPSQKLAEEKETSQNSGMIQSYAKAEISAETFRLVSNTHETKQTTPCGEDFTSSTHVDREEPCLSSQLDDSMDMTEETSTENNQDQLLNSKTFTGTIPSQSVSGFTPEIVESAKHLSFEELIPYHSSQSLETSSDKDRPRFCKQYSEENLTPVDDQCVSSQLKSDLTSSASDDEYDVPLRGAGTTSESDVHTPLGATEVRQSGADSPDFEYSDPEPYFDCKQGMSDFSEPELNGPETTTSSSQAQDQLSHLGAKEKSNQKVLLSSGSEDYEDAPLLLESHRPVQEDSEESQHYSETSEEESQHYSETSEEEFTMCSASQLPGTHETFKSFRREIAKELGSLSESSDDEFLTTRVIRRRIVIKADEMLNLPNQSVTEERYRDENGHIVVKRVTRKVIRKCISAEGDEREEMSAEGGPQGSDGGGYSKVVKRTIVKSEGENTEVTFVKHEGFASSSQESANSCEMSQTKKTAVVEGGRTMSSHGDQSLASDVPSAQDDFKQALDHLGGFSSSALPPVVETEIVGESGNVVRRAHMHKAYTVRVKGDGRHNQVLEEQTDTSRKTLTACDLQQQLHHLFHRCFEQEQKDTDEDKT